MNLLCDGGRARHSTRCSASIPPPEPSSVPFSSPAPTTCSEGDDREDRRLSEWALTVRGGIRGWAPQPPPAADCLLDLPSASPDSSSSSISPPPPLPCFEPPAEAERHGEDSGEFNRGGAPQAAERAESLRRRPLRRLLHGGAPLPHGVVDPAPSRPAGSSPSAAAAPSRAGGPNHGSSPSGPHPSDVRDVAACL